jgi:hypothetical protein
MCIKIISKKYLFPLATLMDGFGVCGRSLQTPKPKKFKKAIFIVAYIIIHPLHK